MRAAVLPSLRRSEVAGGLAIRIALDTAEGLHAAHELKDEAGRPWASCIATYRPRTSFSRPKASPRLPTSASPRRPKSETIDPVGIHQRQGRIPVTGEAFSEPLDRRVDVFALGAVLYEMTTGRRPFAADTQMATLVKLTSSDPAPPVEDLVQGYPRELAAVVRRALDKDRTARFSGMESSSTSCPRRHAASRGALMKT